MFTEKEFNRVYGELKNNQAAILIDYHAWFPWFEGLRVELLDGDKKIIYDSLDNTITKRSFPNKNYVKLHGKNGRKHYQDGLAYVSTVDVINKIRSIRFSIVGLYEDNTLYVVESATIAVDLQVTEKLKYVELEFVNFTRLEFDPFGDNSYFAKVRYRLNIDREENQTTYILGKRYTKYEEAVLSKKEVKQLYLESNHNYPLEIIEETLNIEDLGLMSPKGDSIEEIKLVDKDKQSIDQKRIKIFAKSKLNK